MSAQRHLEPPDLLKAVRGEVDWIVMKALEKDRTRRYQTANGLARDIEHYLADEPVEACPPSTRYRLRKFLHQHRTAARTAAAFIALLVLALGVSIWLAVRARQAELRAMESRNAESEQRRIMEEQRDRAIKAELLARENQAKQLEAESRARQPEEQLDRSRLQLSEKIALVNKSVDRQKAMVAHYTSYVERMMDLERAGAVVQRLGQLYEATGKKDEAAKWRKERETFASPIRK